MWRLRRRASLVAGLSVALQLGVIGMAATACCREMCQAAHSGHASGHAAATAGDQCPMHASPTAQHSADGSHMECGCDHDRALAALVGPAAVIPVGPSALAGLRPMSPIPGVEFEEVSASTFRIEPPPRP